MNQLMQIYEKKLTVPTGAINGVMCINSDDEYSSSESEDDANNNQYEQDFIKEEMGLYAQFSVDGNRKKTGQASQDLCDVEGVEGFEYKNNATNIYSNYNFSRTFVNNNLPINSFKQNILDMVRVNNVVIIHGATGCGKTTQVPQYILDYCKEKNVYCNIAVTQPRKIATINVARRVCEERGWTLGSVCGYQIGLERKTSPNVLLTYMTTGTLLQKIINDKHLNQFTHIIIDEVHERNMELDFLLLIVRKFLFTNSPKTKVILMSATIEAEEFAHYFRCQNFNVPLPAPIIYVNKKSSFTKTIFYMEQLSTARESARVSMPNYDIDQPEICDGLWKIFVFLVSIFDKLDDVDNTTGEKVIGSVLVFLPGINEIEEAKKRLEADFERNRSKPEIDPNSKEKKIINFLKWEIIPLHSSLPNDEQARVFQPASPNSRKIILSTNIAESSITVPDTCYVIDFCQTKVMVVDPVTKFMSLKLEWASHVNCEQRAGRVGRVRNGRIYRLVPVQFYNEQMSSRSVPEIQNAPLDRVVLHAKALNLRHTPAQILALALNPPNLKNISNTILNLKEIGALLQTCRGIKSSCDGDLTFMGKVMSKLPVDVKLTKLILLGQLFSCLEETIIIAAGCSIQNIFSIPFQQKFNAYEKLLMWADGSSSDLIALLNLYQVWQRCRRDNHLNSWQSQQNWCNINLVSLKGLREWGLLVTELKKRLEMLNIRETSGPGRVALSPFEKPLVLKVITAGAFYPNFFVKAPIDVETRERDAVKLVGGRDPYKTVYLTGMDPYQPGPLYIKAVKQMFNKLHASETDVFVGFDGSSKIYVEFKSRERRTETIPISVNGFQQVTNLVTGKIPFEVYGAIRKRQLNYDFSLQLLPSEDAWELAEINGIKRSSTLQTFTTSGAIEERNCFSDDTNFNPIPSLDTEYITLKITEYIDASRFWANTLESEYYLAKIEEALNKQLLHRVVAVENPEEKRLKLGKFYAARYSEDNLFYRCKIIAHSTNSVQIIFIDYGNMQQVPPGEIYLLPDTPECYLPPLSIECVLHGVRPSLKHNPKGIWSDKVNDFCKKHVVGILLYGKVHSVVDDVVYLELYKSQHSNRVKSVNQFLIDQEYAEPMVESFLCRADHEKRQMVINASNPSFEAARLSCDRALNSSEFDMPKTVRYEKTVQLKGPYSPLEMKLHGCIESATNKAIDIDGSSVNTVLLDTEPQAYQTSLLVAGYVGQTGNGSRLRLRQTTLLPNIPGLPMVLTLLFCPTMAVKLVNDGTRVASILCGLGYNEYTNKSYYPAHDLTLTLDTELTENEVNKINQMRFYMNQGIKLMNDISDEVACEDEMIRTQNCLKTELKELIYMKRQIMERVNIKFANVWWRNNVDAVVLKPNMCDEDEDIWPLLWFVKLNPVPENYSPNVRKNLDDLDLIAQRMMPVPKDFVCELCQEALVTMYEVRYHLISDAHKNAVKIYYEHIQQFNDTDSED